MARNRVLSFMSAFAPPKSPQSTSFSGPQNLSQQDMSSPTSQQHAAAPARDSTIPRTRSDRPSSRPMSMVQTYQPHNMEIAQDTIPELQPIFTFLNSHANKLYQEGYFLKLNDLDSQGRPNADRSWTESFAQLVGTVLSLWDAAALDAAGQDGEVAPTFINLADASIKMIETLPTRSADVLPLQNVLSVSTAGKNRYLLHFNSMHSLTQWTAAIRLAMYENATLQEAYTGSLIAGKGKLLNNIKVIMERTRIRNEDWTRVRFGAGTPWRRCWCVISPPDEKEVVKHQKQMRKRSAYERATPLKGKIQFFDTKKTKKMTPIATINDAYSAYAIYPQSKPLIDQSTLIKVEGSITIHASPPITTEGFVFVMPEVHPAVSGFEMMLRYIFPLYDVFALYGRPNRLAADTQDVRSLMFALPQERRYGYLEILDVAGLVHETGSQTWSEREWRKRLRDLTAVRMKRMTSDGRPRSRASSYRDYRNSLPGGRTLRYEDGASIKSTPSLRNEMPPVPPPHRSDTDPINGTTYPPQAVTPPRPKGQHQRSFSEAYPGNTPRSQRNNRNRYDPTLSPSRLSYEQSGPSTDQTPSGMQSPDQEYQSNGQGPPIPSHGVPLSVAAHRAQMQQRYPGDLEPSAERSSSESERRSPALTMAYQHQDAKPNMQPAPPPAQVTAPPAFSHEPGAKPRKRPGITPDMQRANSRLSITTLQQLTDAGKNSNPGNSVSAAAAAAAWRSTSSGAQSGGRKAEEQNQHGVNDTASAQGINADRSTSAQGVESVISGYTTPEGYGSRNGSTASSQQDPSTTPYYKDKPLMSSYDLLTPQSSVHRKVSPLSQSTSPSPLQNQSEFSTSSFDATDDTNIENPIVQAAHEQHSLLSYPQRPSASRSSTAHSITRKPLPSPSRSAASVPSSLRDENADGAPALETSVDSLHDQYVDEDALARILEAQRLSSLTNEPLARAEGIHGGRKSENESVNSLEHVQIHEPTGKGDHAELVEQPRRGVMKTVGTLEPETPRNVQIGDINYRAAVERKHSITSAIPFVDFGPTQKYNPAAVKQSPSGKLVGTFAGKASNSQEHVQQESLRQNTQATKEAEANYQQTSDRRAVTPDLISRNAPGAAEQSSRNMAWQPAVQMRNGSPGPRQSITPEQFVQQRAAAARIPTPVYAHNRQNSSSPTPPNRSRESSGEWPLSQPKHVRNVLQRRHSSTSNDIPSRPNSRAASHLMQNPADYNEHLSAREQEHVARATGSPLLNMAQDNSRRTPSPGNGLIGAIEAREKEKRDIKDGLSGQMVQQAIAQRLHHGQQQSSYVSAQQPTHPQRYSSYGAPMQQFAAPNPQFIVPGAFPPSPGQYPSRTATPEELQWQTPLPGPMQQYGQYQAPFSAQAQQLPRSWTPPSAGQFVGPPQNVIPRTTSYQQHPGSGNRP